MLKPIKAVRQQKKLKACLMGPSGSGKTYSALLLAKGLKNGGRVLVADTERGSASLYADLFDFDTVDLPDFQASTYKEAMKLAEQSYDVLVIDSLSHAWEELLEELERVQKRDRSKQGFAAWSVITPIYKDLVEAILQTNCHIIVTMRSKTEWVIEQNDKGRNTPRKVGLAPVFRSGGEYEFDLVAEVDNDHQAVMTKTRINYLDGYVGKLTEDDGRKLRDWLSGGAEPAPAPQPEPKKPTAHTDNGIIYAASDGLHFSNGDLTGKLIPEASISDLDNYLSAYGPTSKFPALLQKDELVAVMTRITELGQHTSDPDDKKTLRARYDEVRDRIRKLKAQ